ncbi:MAG TPA: transglycosylase domain-containing protein, partial [Geminicoccaceae bacterium]|nr:transglycosylase domain-containing protein [Geminicoccaceae bacterium]
MSTRRIAAPETGRQERQRLPFAVRWLLRLPLVLCLVLVLGIIYLSLDFADVSTPAPGERRPAITLLDRGGTAFARYGDYTGEALTVAEMSPWLPQAVVAIEDRRFWRHPGFDPIGIARAAWRNLTAGGVVQGGSTITQQLAKVAFLSPERSFKRKLQEALYAVWLELRFDKEQILQAYLNRIYLGAGAYGVDGAARRYFGKSARDVTLPEAAMLAGLIRAPSRYAPTRDLELARGRAAVVLDGMAEAGFVTPEQAREAKARPAALTSGPAIAGGGYFADWVFGESRALAGGDRPRLTVRTTLDRDLQAAAERVLADVLGRSSATQGALVAMTPDGEVRAMVGGADYRASQFNRAAQALRQPGSAFKLFVFLAALEQGWRPGDAISAARLTVDGWTPVNFADEYPVRVTLEEAFARSVNTAAVRLMEQVGRDRAIEMAHRLG